MVKWLWENLVVAWQTMRKGVGEVSSFSDREPLSTKVFWEETKPYLTVTSYVVKPKSAIKQAKCVDFINHAANPRGDRRRREEEAGNNQTL